MADFDAFLAKNPKEGKGHWQRGIACYYAGKYVDGQKQFESYQDFDNADIETVIHAASEIVGFNYVLGPGVTGKKVTVQTSAGVIPSDDARSATGGQSSTRRPALVSVNPTSG